MSVLIKGFKMPEDCRDCPLEMYYMNCGETRCRARNKILAENFKAIPFDGRPDWCPLVEVPAPHGDLIDRNALEPDIFPDWDGIGVPDDCYSLRCVRNALPVIEAEGTE